MSLAKVVVIGASVLIGVVAGLVAYYYSQDEQPQAYRTNANGRKKKKFYSDECVICQDRWATMELVPCGHVCLCPECSRALTGRRSSNCPVCRAQIREAKRINN